jgi:hypothetical protein
MAGLDLRMTIATHGQGLAETQIHQDRSQSLLPDGADRATRKMAGGGRSETAGGSAERSWRVSMAQGLVYNGLTSRPGYGPAPEALWDCMCPIYET